MSFDWNALFADSDRQAVFAGQSIVDFGDPRGELAAASESTIVAPLAHLGLMACTGDDAAAFLHNQLTSDVTHLDDGRAQHAAWCTAKGRMIASFLVMRVGGTYLLHLDDGLLPSVLKKLQMYVLRSKVKIADASAGQALLGVAGTHAAAALRAAGMPVPESDLQVATAPDAVVVRLSPERFELAIASERAGELWQRLRKEARPVGTPVWNWLEIEAGIPRITVATREEFVPQMANFDQIGGVSFHKGCYPGQEVIARTQYLGKVKRHLYRVAAAAAIEPGAPIFAPDAPDQACGQIVNASPAPGGGSVALAVLQENAAGGSIRLSSPDGPPLHGATAVAPTQTVAN